MHASDLPIIHEDSLVGYADDSELLAGLSKPSNRVSAIYYSNRNLARIGGWCKQWSNRINPIKNIW